MIYFDRKEKGVKGVSFSPILASFFCTRLESVHAGTVAGGEKKRDRSS